MIITKADVYTLMWRQVGTRIYAGDVFVTVLSNRRAAREFVRLHNASLAR